MSRVVMVMVSDKDMLQYFDLWAGTIESEVVMLAFDHWIGSLCLYSLTYYASTSSIVSLVNRLD